MYLPREWNYGKVECWNIGFQKDINHFKFIVNPVGGGTINLSEAYTLRRFYEPEAIIPSGA
jgi:hypothetical protein